MENSLKISEVVKNLQKTNAGRNKKFNSNGNSKTVSEISIKKIIDLCYKVIYPGYFDDLLINDINIESHLFTNIEKLQYLIYEQMKNELGNDNSHDKALKSSINFIEKLPTVKEYLFTDIEAIYNGDPAAKSISEIILCYPGIKAITHHRIAHILFKSGFMLIARMISETAHSETGIDIHPGAEIGKYFAIDHGTGVVIGETCIIGDNVKIYQGVTLGAKSFPKDKDGNPIKGINRHPIVEDGVVIYSGATILGRIKIGKNSVIGGNVWLTSDLEAGSKIVQCNVASNEVIFDTVKL